MSECDGPRGPFSPPQIPQHVASLARAVDDHLKALLSAGRYYDTALTGLALDGAVQAYYQAERLGRRAAT